MRILLLGATGGTGREVIAQAVDRGLDVTAVVRSPERLGDVGGPLGRVRVVAGDVFDAGTLAAAAAGCAAAVSCLGSEGGFLGRGATTVYSAAAAALVRALPAAGVARLVFCTSAGVEARDPAEPLPYRLIAKPFFLQRAYDDMITAERRIAASSLDWTLVRPARLTDRPGTGTYRVSPRFRTPGGKGVARADVASFMLDQAGGQDWIRATPTLTT